MTPCIGWFGRMIFRIPTQICYTHTPPPPPPPPPLCCTVLLLHALAQVKKTNKWVCKICNEQQAITKVGLKVVFESGQLPHPLHYAPCGTNITGLRLNLARERRMQPRGKAISSVKHIAGPGVHDDYGIQTEQLE